MIRVGINGYGRIGRLAHRVILEKYSRDIEVVGINAGSSTDLEGWMYLLKYDSNYGPLKGHEFSFKDSSGIEGYLGELIIDGKDIPLYSQKDASLLPWEKLGAEVVLECTGHIRTTEKAKAHLKAGAKKVIISAPSDDDDTSTYILSVNSDSYKGEDIISNASCTTNCIAPVAKIIDDAFGVEKAMMTTIHAYTSDQRLQDGGHKDYRRQRAAGKNIVPTTTGATIAAAKAVPTLKDKFVGLSIRVPVAVGSLADFTFLVKKSTTVEEVNGALEKAAEHHGNKDIFTITHDPIVSSDIIGDTHSSVADLSLTQVVGGTMVKVIAWYDNELGYAHRLVEEALLVAPQK